MKCHGASLLAVVAALTLSCRGVSTSHEDLSCERGRCRGGYECRSDTDMCVPRIERSCDGSGVCWSGVSTGDPCTSEGSFVPCSEASDCSGGCRTCDGGQWSSCEGSCEVGTATNCAQCGDDCTAKILNATAQCVEGACTFGTCDATFRDADQIAENGCECGPVRPERCNGLDDDCDGQTDEMSPADVQTQCDARFPDVNVDAWHCDAGCAITQCTPGSENTDGRVINGCEGGCTTAGAEVCDGLDNDCDGTTDVGVDLVDCTPFYRDDDEDGWGVDDDSQCLCAPAAPYDTTEGGDCDDDPQACGAACNGGVTTDPCDGFDNDCNGTPDPGCEPLFDVLDSSTANLINDDVTALALRSDGALAVGTSGAGQASFLAAGASTFADVADLKTESVRTVIAVGSDFWFAYEEGYCDTNEGCGTPQCGPERVAENPYAVTLQCTDDVSTGSNGAWSLAHDPDTGDVYIGTNDDHTVYKAALDSVECDIAQTNNERLVAATVDADSPRHLWFGTYSRLYECVPDHTGAGRCSDSCSSRDNAFDGNDDVSTITFDDAGTRSDTSDDVLWVASLSKGLARYRISDDTRQGQWSVATILPSNRVNAVAIARGAGAPRAYIGTDAGLVVLDIAFGDFTTYTTGTTPALPSNVVTALAVDTARNRLWVGTDAGVVRAQPLP